MKTALPILALGFLLTACAKSPTTDSTTPTVATNAPPPAVTSPPPNSASVAPAAPAPPAAPSAVVTSKAEAVATVSATPPSPTPPPPTPTADVAAAAVTQLQTAAATTNPPARSALDTIRGAINKATNYLATNLAAKGVSTNPAPTSAAPATASVSVAAADLSTDQITKGLKEALARGLDHAIGQLGKDGGFLTNANVRIPMPEQLQTVEKLLRRAGQNQLADEFVATMNHAAEKAVPAAAGVFGDSLKQMSVEDARGILQGPNDAATQYFRRKAGPQLMEKFKPIVANATAQTGVTAAYKQLMDRASILGPFLKKESLDLDDYVTAQASDGLFKMVADEEKKIRENPTARATDLLRSVFGSVFPKR